MAISAPFAAGLLRPRVSSKSHGRIRNEDILAFFQQLSTLFRSGTPIYEAIVIAADQTQSDKLRAVVGAIARRVAAGSELNVAMADHHQVFKVEWTEIIRSGEHSGQLETMLDRLAAQIDAAHQLRGKLVSAMMYPAIIMVVALLALVVMLVKVVPTFASMFAAMGGELPGITRSVLDLSAFLQDHLLQLAGGVALVVLGLRRWLRTPGGRRVLDRLLLAAPLLGEVAVQAMMQKFASNTALMLRAGMPILEAVQSVEGVLANTVYRRGARQVCRHLERGGSLADGLRDTGLFTSLVVSMARTGEASGALPDVLDEVELFYRRKVEAVAERLANMLETVVILGMGLCVAVILCSVYLPMFSMASGVR